MKSGRIKLPDCHNIVGDALWDGMQWLVWMYLIFIPEHEAGRESVIEILNKLVAQIKRTQDPATGVWYQVIDRSGDEGNYLESSCSTMFVYTLLKALRKGYICPSYMEVAKKGV